MKIAEYYSNFINEVYIIIDKKIDRNIDLLCYIFKHALIKKIK